MKRTTAGATLLCALALLMPAQAERSAQIVFFQAPADAPAAAFAHVPEGEPIEIKLVRHNFSKSFKLPDGNLDLRFLGEALAPESKMPEGAPSLKIPERWEKILVIAFSDPKNQIFPVSFKAINASASKFGIGDTMFVNFTEAAVFGTFGKQKLVIKPKERVVASDASEGGSSYKVRLNSVTRVEMKTGGTTLIRQVWRQYPDARQLVFFHTSDGGAISYQSFPIHDL